MIYWWQKQPKYKKLALEVRMLFLKNGIIPPQDLLPSVIFPNDTPEILFKTKLRQIIRDKITIKNFYFNKRNELITIPQGSGLIQITDYKEKKEYDELLERKKIDLRIRGESQ